jgi:hypothetical protein
MVAHSSTLRSDRPYNPLVQARRFGLFRVRSPLLAESLSCFLFLWVLRWFTSPRSPPPTYGFSRGSLGMTQGGLPHSEIAGSKPVCGSPTLIAADHVLHRLLAPRHSPYALSSLTIINPDAYRYQCHSITPCEAILQLDSSTHQELTRTACCGRKKLPFAGYSVVKEQRGPSNRRATKTAKDQLAIFRQTNTGGEYRARTGDLLVANQALSQLS